MCCASNCSLEGAVERLPSRSWYAFFEQNYSSAHAVVVANNRSSRRRVCSCLVRVHHVVGGNSTSCYKCGRGSQRPIGPGSASKEAGQGPPQGSVAIANGPGGRDAAKLAHPRHPPDTGHHDRGGATMNLVGTIAKEQMRAKSESCCEEESLARAGAAFDCGMKAYMREDAEVGEGEGKGEGEGVGCLFLSQPSA